MHSDDDRFVWHWECRSCPVVTSIGPMVGTPETADTTTVETRTRMASYAHMDWHGCANPDFEPPTATRIPTQQELDDGDVGVLPKIPGRCPLCGEPADAPLTQADGWTCPARFHATVTA